MEEMDMDDKTSWMIDLNTSKIVSTVWCKQWSMKQEQRLSGSRDVVWMTKLVRQMKSGTAEEWNEREIESMKQLKNRETIYARVFINSL